MRISDWSADVCSSDLCRGARRADLSAAVRSAAPDEGGAAMIESIMRRPFLWLGGLFALLLVLSSTLFVVPETQQAIVVRLGKPNRIANAYDERQAFGLTGAGLVPPLPFLDTVLMIDTRLLDLDLAPPPVLSTAHVRLGVGASPRV